MEKRSEVTSIKDPTAMKRVQLKLVDVARLFKRNSEGDDPENTGIRIDNEYQTFTVVEKADWSQPKLKLRSALQEPFNYIAELFTKNMASHVGGHTGISENKIRAVSAIYHAVNGKKYNWESWFTKQLHEIAKDFIPCESDPSQCTLQSKLRYSGKISYALEQLFPRRVWKSAFAYKIKIVFDDLIKSASYLDGNLIDVFIRQAIPTTPEAAKRKAAKNPARAKQLKHTRVAEVRIP